MLHHHLVHKNHGNIFVKIFHGIVMAVAMTSPLITLPQLLSIYVTRNASGVSPITWSAYIFTSIIWLSYGVMHRERVIIINGVLGVILGATIFLGILIYN